MNEDTCSCASPPPPSFSKRINGSKEHSNAVKQPTLVTCLSSSSSYASLSTLPCETNNNINKKRVSFNELVKVVLIPTRREYKHRGLELMLWWNPKDYALFQQEARAEITVCATSETISFTQARTKLYQPDPNEIDPFFGKFTTPQSISNVSLQPIGDDGDYFTASVDSSPINTQYSLHNRNSNDSSDGSNNSTDHDTSDDSDEDNQDKNSMSDRIRFYQNSPKPSQASSSLRMLSKRMSSHALDTYHEDAVVISGSDKENEYNSCTTNVADSNTNGEITSTANAIAKYCKSATSFKLTKSMSCPALASITTTSTTTTTNSSKSQLPLESSQRPRHHSLSQSPADDLSQELIDDLHMCVLSSKYQSLTCSTTYSDTYLERHRKRNIETNTSSGIDFSININTPSFTACSVFALSVVSVVTKYF